MFDDRRIAAVVLAALVTAPALAGCLGGAQAAALEQKETADDRAQDWDPDAQLAGVVGLEGNTSGAGYTGGDYDYDGSADYWDPAREDDSPGDGRIAVWVYRYVSPNKPGTTFVVVVHDGEVEETEEDDDGEEALPDFSVDSDEAAEIAAENNQGIAQAQGSDNYGFVYNLETNETGVPTWFVAGGGGDEESGGGGFVVIDARNGDVLASRSGSYQDGGSGEYDYGGGSFLRPTTR